MRRLTVAMAAAGLVATGLIVTAPAQAAPPKVSAKAAQVKVLKKVRGQVLGITPSTRDGFTSWAVRVKRADGSIVVGYVDAKSGIIFDWTVQEGPGEPVVDLDGPDRELKPAAAPVPVLPSPMAAPTLGAVTSGASSSSTSDPTSTATSEPEPSSSASAHDDDEHHSGMATPEASESHRAESSRAPEARPAETHDSHHGDDHHDDGDDPHADDDD